MTLLTAARMLQIALVDYFGSISADTIKATVEHFFTPQATFTLYPSGRLFTGHAEIERMYSDVFARHPVIEREVLDTVVDPQSGRMSASFRAYVPVNGGTPVIMHNVNFWQFEGEKFGEVKVFSSDAGL